MAAWGTSSLRTVSLSFGRAWDNSIVPDGGQTVAQWSLFFLQLVGTVTLHFLLHAALT